VRELTGDMSLTKKELTETQMIVTTPEKWDVITRKGGEVSMVSTVKLLIIDEVHLLNDSRGPVIETIVARTQRLVETTQDMIRIVGLSATLPNYLDVAKFLGVNQETGLFYFDASYRPVPLAQWYIGVTESNFVKRTFAMNNICYDKVYGSVQRGHQAMVFVHSRKETGKTARILMELAQSRGHAETLDPKAEHPMYHLLAKEVKKSRNREMAELFEHGFGIHHAGMLRSDRNIMEKLFAEGLIKVLVCTATLAWGVNLPAHMVVIKGTQVYDSQKGAFGDLGMLDVMQIFGRAGRPQYGIDGEAVIITSHNKLAKYLGLLTHQLPIESQFVAGLADNLNAELVLGSVSNVREAVQWLGYTYLFVRMLRNPLAYALTWQDLELDPRLELHRKKLITEAARTLDRARSLRFDEKSGNLYSTEQGRVASHFYIVHRSMEVYTELMKRHMSEADLFFMVAQSAEFENIQVRDEEIPEIEQLNRKQCPIDVKGGIETKHGKANVLLQVYISRARVESFSLQADLNYISQSVGRIFRGSSS
ncbi:activating signal cointegrator 1 complex subunit, partial [Cymbomonas tetramitiformis]